MGRLNKPFYLADKTFGKTEFIGYGRPVEQRNSRGKRSVAAHIYNLVCEELPGNLEVYVPGSVAVNMEPFTEVKLKNAVVEIKDAMVGQRQEAIYTIKAEAIEPVR